MSSLDAVARPAPNSKPLLRWSAAGAGALMLAAGVAFAFASMRAAGPAAGATDAVIVTLRDGACQPNALTVPAGRSTFQVVNATDRVVEWEILDGVMVLEERENIAPGLTQTLNARLAPGTYSITCGLLSNPRGTLTVTPAATAGEPPQLVAFVGPLAEYQVFLTLQANALVKAATALDEAIAAGDIDKARELYPKAREPYGKMQPIAARFADLDGVIAPVAAYLEKHEADPGFVGFHRIEYGLFRENSLDGLKPVSARLVSDVTALKERLRASKLTPDAIGSGAVRVLARLGDGLAAGGAKQYGGPALADVAAQVAGVRKIVTLLAPLSGNSAPAQAKQVDADLAAVEADMAGLRGPEGSYPPLASLGDAARGKLSGALQKLGEALDRLNDAIGLGRQGAS